MQEHGAEPGTQSSASTLHTKLVFPSRRSAARLKITPSSTQSLPSERGTAFREHGGRISRYPFCARRKPRARSIGFGRRVPVARHPGRQATRGYRAMLRLHPLFWGGERVWGNNPLYIQGWCGAASVGCGQHHRAVTPAGFTDRSGARSSSPTSTRSAQCLLELCVLTLINLLCFFREIQLLQPPWAGRNHARRCQAAGPPAHLRLCPVLKPELRLRSLEQLRSHHRAPSRN